MRGDPPHCHIVGDTSLKASAMEFLIVLTAAAMVIGDRLEGAHSPPTRIGLQPPLERTQKYGSASSSAAAATILRYDNEVTALGYSYAYDTSDGTRAEQQGRVVTGADGEAGALRVSGSYSYVGDDGQTYSVTYVADELGYRAQVQGAHLPPAPRAPAPETILNTLQLTDTSRGHYDSQKSSYDADAGY